MSRCGPRVALLNAFGPVFAAAIGIELTIAFIASGLAALDTRGPDVGAGFGSPEAIGQLLLTRFLVPFEAASYLLLIAAVGAVVLARRRRGLEDIGALEEVGAPPDRRRRRGDHPRGQGLGWTSSGSSSCPRSSS